MALTQTATKGKSNDRDLQPDKISNDSVHQLTELELEVIEETNTDAMNILKSQGFKFLPCTDAKRAKVKWKNDLPWEKCKSNITGGIIPENIYILDMDRHPGKPDGIKAFEEIRKKYGIPDNLEKETLAIKTRDNGKHLYFFYNGTEELQNHPLTFPDGTVNDCIELKQFGGMIITPASKGWNALNTLEPMELPESLLMFVKVNYKTKTAAESKVENNVSDLQKVLDQLDVKKFASNGLWQPLIQSSKAYAGNTPEVNEALFNWSISDTAYSNYNEVRGRIERFKGWNKPGDVSKGTFFYICNRYGIKAPNNKPVVILPETKKKEKKPLTLPAGMITLSDLSKKEIPPLQWVIPGIIPEGLTIIGGAPKAGKSFLILNIVLQIATGSKALGKFPVNQGKILYLALEDSERRLQSRMKKTGYDLSSVSGSISTEWGAAYSENIEMIDLWMEENPDTKVIAIDTIQDFSKIEEGNSYSEVTLALARLKDLSHKHNIGILIVHHTKKSESENIIHNLIGSVGYSSKPDTIIILTRRKTGEGDRGKLEISGRDIDAKELQLKFDSKTETWLQDDNAPPETKTDQRQEIVDLLAENSEPMKTSDIALALGREFKSTQNLISRMKKDTDIIMVKYGWYTLPTTSNINPEFTVEEPF